MPQKFHPGWQDKAWAAVNVAYNGVPPPMFAMTNLEVILLLTAFQDVLASISTS